MRISTLGKQFEETIQNYKKMSEILGKYKKYARNFRKN